MVDPVSIDRADYLLVESTYGNRSHDKRDPAEALAELSARWLGRGGTVVIPAFAVGRAQSLLVHFERLKARVGYRTFPYSSIARWRPTPARFCKNIKDHKLSEAECRRACAVAHYVRSVEESKALTFNPMPKVIISASGMATGGRVLHHLKHYAPERKTPFSSPAFRPEGREALQ